MMPDWLPIATAITLAGSLVSIGIWIGSVNTKQKNFTEALQEIKEDIREINKNILKIFSRLGPDVTDTQSPIVLSDLGEEISKELNTIAWANRFADVVQKEVVGKDAYSIQEFSFEYVKNDECYSAEELHQIRDAAYKYGISDKSVRRVVGVQLRDILLDLAQKDAPE